MSREAKMKYKTNASNDNLFKANKEAEENLRIAFGHEIVE
jgi:hypothetical protein